MLLSSVALLLNHDSEPPWCLFYAQFIAGAAPEDREQERREEERRQKGERTLQQKVRMLLPQEYEQEEHGSECSSHTSASHRHKQKQGCNRRSPTTS